MSATIAEKLAQIKRLEREIEADLAARRQQFHYQLRRGRVLFDDAFRREQRALRVPLRDFLARTRPLFVLTAPFIYAVIIGFVVLDLLASLYQAICFPVYGIQKVRRRDYIAIDRQYLPYLNALQKLNCVYCGYGNGLLAYVSEISARTEQYWCPIKHAHKLRAHHARYALFVDYGDGAHFAATEEALREKLHEELEAPDKAPDA